MLRAGRSGVRTSPPRLTTLTACIKMVEGKVFPVHVTKAYCGSRRIAPLILHLGTKWRSVVSFTSRLLCHRERIPLSIEFKAGWATWRYGHFGVDKYLLTLSPFGHWIVQPRRLVTIPTELSRLLFVLCSISSSVHNFHSQRNTV